jgi:hypothetical protein
MAAIVPEQTAIYGLSTNKNNGIYNHGYKFDIEKKLSVQASYQSFKEVNGGLCPNLTHIACDCKVSPSYVKKLKNEMNHHGRVLHPEEKKQKRKIGPGANSLDTLYSFVLLVLYLMEDSTTLQSCREQLFRHIGTLVSDTTISRFFNHAFPIKGGPRKPTLVPYDKFKPENILRARDYMCPSSPKPILFGSSSEMRST